MGKTNINPQLLRILSKVPLLTHVTSVLTEILLKDWRNVNQTFRSALIFAVTRVW